VSNASPVSSTVLESIERQLDVLRGLRRGIEKESLRVAPDGTLAQTSHPGFLGSPLTHTQITTDF
jgi:glutamate--cysteine ligase